MIFGIDPIYIMMVSLLLVIVFLGGLGIYLRRHLLVQEAIRFELSTIRQSTSGTIKRIPLNTVSPHRILEIERLTAQLRTIDPIKEPKKAEQVASHLAMESSHLLEDTEDVTQLTMQIPPIQMQQKHAANQPTRQIEVLQ